MSPQPEVPFQQYVDQRFIAFEKLMDEKVNAHRESVDISLKELDRFRIQLSVLNDKITPRELYEEKHAKLETRVQLLESWKATVAGRTAVIVIVVSTLIGIVGAFIGHLFP